jgi:conjugal transfer pilus assembly protein TraD
MEILAKKVKEKGLFERDYVFIKGALYLGRGWNLRHKFDGKKPRIVDIYKSPDMRSTHLVSLGRSRWGKTRLLERVIVDDIESGLSIFHLDPKLDYDGTEAIIDAVDKTERYDDAMFFIPPYPEVSIRVNPFAGLLPDAISDIVKAMAPSSKEEFFRELAGEIAKAVSTALYLLGETEINFATLFKYTSVEEINELYKRVQNAKAEGYVQIGDEIVEKARLKADALLSLNKLRQKDKTYWSKVNTTIELILSQITTGKVGQVFGRAKGNPFRERLLLGKPVIFSGLIGSLYIGKDPAQKIARMINAMSEKVYGAIYRKFSRLNPPLAEYWDEGSITIYTGAEEKINKVGGAGGYIHIFTQSLADFKMNIGEEQTKVFIDNADVVLMSVKDTETAEYFSRSAGEVDRFKPIWNKEEITAMPTKEPLIPPDQFMRLNKGAFHAFIEGRWYQGYSPLLKGRRKLILAPLPYEEKRIFEHFKRKYKIDDRTATEWIRKYDVVYDYDWILKEKLADDIIDLREFPYYKNYVANYKEDFEKEITISSGLDIEKLRENAELIRQALNQKQGIFPKAILKDNKLFLDLYLYQKIFGKPAESREKITIEGKNKEYALIILDSETLSLFKAHV